MTHSARAGRSRYRSLIRGAATLLPAICFLIAIASAQLAPAESVNGAALFESRCKMCHEPSVAGAPGRIELEFRAPADIVSALTTGVMAPMAQGLSHEEMDAIADYLAPGQAVGLAGVDKICASHDPIRENGSDWPAMGLDDSSRRFQRHPQLHAADVPRLKVKWAFAMPGGGQPTVIGDWLFITNRSGKFYALDAKTGCVHWAVEGTSSRTTPPVIRSAISPSGWVTFVGAGGRVLRAFDAHSGKQLWRSEALEAHPASFLTGSPVVFRDRIFVPISSGEEPVAMEKNYSCCSFRGSLVALDLTSGRRLWQTYMITEALHPTHKNAIGVQMQGPAGAPIWAAPTVDPKRGLVYAVTGDSYTDVSTDTTDAIVAVDMKTGQVRWRNQVTTGDNYIQGCVGATKAPNCPAPTGPDYDFGAAPVLFGRGGRHQVLVAAQKSGIVYGLDPDTGRLLWKTAVGAGSVLGGVEWGIAADDRYVFVPISDIGELFDETLKSAGRPPYFGYQTPGRPGLSALDPFSGKIIWSTPAPIAPCKYAGDRSEDFLRGACVRAQSAAPGVMPGLVFSGTLDGWLRAYDVASGKIMWAFSTTAQTYDTVNAVLGQPGGGIDGMGPTIARGMVYTMSGSNGAARTGGNGMNVLLAFSVDGR